MTLSHTTHPTTDDRLMSRKSTDTVVVPRTANGMPPGPATPMMLQTIRFRSHRHRYLPEMHERYGDVVTLRVAPQGTMVLLRNPDHIREVFRGMPEVFHAGEGNLLLRPVVGLRSVLTMDAPEHREERRRLMPPFHSDRIAAVTEMMAEIAEREVRSWPVGSDFPLLSRTYALTLEIIVRVVLGVEDPVRAAELGAALRRALDINLTDILVWIRPELRRIWPWRKVIQKIDRADELIYAEISRRRADPDRDQRPDVLSMLLAGEPDDDLVRDELMTLLVAGHETTAVALAWTFERLLRHPDALARLRSGLDDPRDPYRNAVFKETLRVRPVIHNVARRLTEPIELAGYHLPAGVSVQPSIGATQSDKRFWGPDADRFRPERWLEPNVPAHAWLPFGGGARRCLGAIFAEVEVVTVVAAVLRKVELEAVGGADEPGAMRHITMIPRRGATIRVRKRLDAGSFAG